MKDTQSWYIVKNKNGCCEIVEREKIDSKQKPDEQERWGPFAEPGEAIARRVGLIRAGKCQPE